MCCRIFPLAVPSLDVSAAAAPLLQHPGKAVRNSTGREPGAVLHPYSQSSPSALCLLPEERFFSPFDASSVLDSTAGEGGKGLLWCFSLGIKSELKKEKSQPKEFCSFKVNGLSESQVWPQSNFCLNLQEASASERHGTFEVLLQI